MRKRCIGLYRSVSDANVRKRAQDHRGPAGLNAAPDPHLHGLHRPTRFRELRTLCLCRAPCVRDGPEEARPCVLS
jgi:hypothetical protein